MRKERLQGEIRNKFIVKQKSTGLILLEDMSESGLLSMLRYPAIFNTEEDAKRYLNIHAEEKDNLEDIIIENTYISYFNQGVILIDFCDGKDELVERLSVKDLKEILEKYKSDKPIYWEIHGIFVPITNITVDTPHSIVTLNNLNDSQIGTVSELYNILINEKIPNYLRLQFGIIVDDKESLRFVYNITVKDEEDRLVLDLSNN